MVKPSTLEKQTVYLEDRHLHVNLRVKYGSREKTPVVMLHGWPITSASWEDVIGFIDDDRTYFCPDLRGLGETERTGNVDQFSKLEISKDCISLLNHLDYQSYIIVGQDWGGIAAQEIAMAIPDRIEKLVVMNINLINNLQGNIAGAKTMNMAPENPRWYITFQSIPDLPERMITGNEEHWIRYITSFTAEGNAVDESLIEEYIRAYSLPGTAQCGANYYRSMFLDIQRWASLGQEKITVPSLIIYGNQDPFINRDYYQEYASCFDSVEFSELHAGHFVQDEKPEDVARLIRQFVSPAGGCHV